MTFREMVKIIDREVHPVRTEDVSVISALGRISARDVRAGKAMPSRDVSALDGFALKGTGETFAVKGELDPFSVASIPLKKGEAVFVATGSPFPRGTRFVAREHVRETAGRILVQTEKDDRKAICKGDWLRKGEGLTGKGEAVTPSAMERLALAGRTALPVYKRPTVAIVSTGNELKKGRIVNSNGFLLAGLVERDGGKVVSRAIAGDTEEEIRERIAEADGADLLVLTGGTSKGKKDLTKHALAGAGARFFLESPSITPGKTMTLGKKGGVYCFILPGNPHAIRSLYELFIRRALYRLAGRRWQEEAEWSLPMPREIRKPQDMIMAVPVRIDFTPRGIVETYPEEPNAFVVIEGGTERIPAGKKVKVLLI